MVKGVKIVKLSCITRVSYHYLTFNLDAFIKLYYWLQYIVEWYRPETVNISNILCIMLQYTIALKSQFCMNLCYVGNLSENG